MHVPYCTICDEDHTTSPAMVLARWRDQDICTDCLTNRPGKDEAEAEAITPVQWTPTVTGLELREARILVGIVIQKCLDHGVLVLPLSETQAQQLAAADGAAVQAIAEKFAQESPY